MLTLLVIPALIASSSLGNKFIPQLNNSLTFKIYFNLI